ncbi:hypothetical protein OBBRIDRAFT_802147 [Obba rivulosa]|uniref:Uncharacterized protein n=1 Tax=Obba rivulosa TaxID=1052685 RepID=A0A8E2B5L2_9APHY|nr:hypothetical protein OBBRIDRAFT_802147 [Obba rivulosa]
MPVEAVMWALDSLVIATDYMTAWQASMYCPIRCLRAKLSLRLKLLRDESLLDASDLGILCITPAGAGSGSDGLELGSEPSDTESTVQPGGLDPKLRHSTVQYVQHLTTLQGWYCQIECNILDTKSKDSKYDTGQNAVSP